MNRLIMTTAFVLAITVTVPATAAEVDEIVAKTNHTVYYQGEDGRAKVNMTIR